MKLNDMASRMPDEDLDKSRLNRRAKTEVSDTDFGMDESFGFDDVVGDSSSFDVGGADPFGFNSGSDGFDAFGGMGGMAGMGAPTQPIVPQKSTEDLVFEKAKEAGKVGISFFKDFTSSFKNFSPQSRTTLGRLSAITSIIVGALGVLLLIFGKPIGLQLIVGGGISLGISIIIFTFGYSALKNAPPESLSASDEEVDLFGGDSFGGEGADSDFDMVNDTDFGDFEDFEDFEDVPATAESVGYSQDFDLSDLGISISSNPEEDISKAMSGIDEELGGNIGMISRQALFERACSVLPSCNKNFLYTIDIPEEDRQFQVMDKLVQDAGEMVKTGTTDDIPYLVSLKEKLFYYMLEVVRPKYIKNVDTFVNEIVSIFQFDKETGKRDMSVFGIGELVGDRIYIKLMKGVTAMVSLRDTYEKTKEFTLDMANKMPIILGIDEEGTPVTHDFYKLDSLLITGMPRSGKSWEMAAIMYQMMFFNAPSELNFYIFDPKGDASDFKKIKTPHIRSFVSDDAKILQGLRDVVRVEGERRKKILGSAGCVNIMDYKKNNPDAKMPIIYIIIDEMVALSQRMSKDLKDEFQKLLLELITCLPFVGIRFFGIPHFVKDDVIKKNITRVIPCRISVKGNAEHIEDSCGIKEKDFRNKLTHVGDMCVKMSDEDAKFVHGVVLSASNDTNTELFNYLAKLWAKIEPETIAGSLYEQAIQDKEVKDLMQTNINSISEEDVWDEKWN